MRYICRDYFQRTVCSGRFVLLVLLVWISLCSFFREFVEQLSEMHCRWSVGDLSGMGVLRWGSEYLFYIIHFFDIGISAMGWSGEPSGQAGQKNMAVIAVLLCHYDIGDLLLVVTVGLLSLYFQWWIGKTDGAVFTGKQVIRRQVLILKQD